MTKVKTVEAYNYKLVCKGKLVLIKPSENELDSIPEEGVRGIYVWLQTDEIDGLPVNDCFKPIIISETEDIEIGDLIYSHDKKDLLGNKEKYTTCTKPESLRNNKSYSKVLSLPENFSLELQMIVDGKLKDGDEVLLECGYENLEAGYLGNWVRLTDNYINILPEKEDLSRINYPYLPDVDEVEYKNKFTELICDGILDYKGNGVFGGEKLQQIADIVFKSKSQGNDESWDDIREQYGVAKTTQKFERWLELNYNPPKRKNK